MSLLDKTIWFFLSNKIIVILLIIFAVLGGLLYAPFDWKTDIERNPVPVDAIPDIGENQQIVFTKWMGRSPQDVDDQITYPLTVSLMGIRGVKTIRSASMLGFSSIYIIFDEEIDFYESRTRILEKLNSLPGGSLPPGVQPALGPDATALGQIFWYTLEGRNDKGDPAGGWDLQELRSIQDWNVRYALLSAEGVAEVGSVGGFVKEYQVDVDPDAMRAADIRLEQVIKAVTMSNIDVGARTIEVNSVEYVIRGIGFIKSIEDIENAVVTVRDNTPIYIKQVARVTLGPALRRGALDKEGTEAVGGVVVVRYGENPLAAINNVKEKIRDIQAGLPVKTLADGTRSKVTIIPFYDRTGLIRETLGTLNTALELEILITVIVILVMILHLRSSMLISGMLPLAVLMCFAGMKFFGVDANIVSLSGIAIAIGTIVDMGIIVSENIVKHLEKAGTDEKSITVIFRAVREVGSAVLTAVLTTVVSFLPVFTMTAAEGGKLFKPLAFTKTFALIASILIALFILPGFAHLLFTAKMKKHLKQILLAVLVLLGAAVVFTVSWWAGFIIIAIGVYRLTEHMLPERISGHTPYIITGLAVLGVGISLTLYWLPLGPGKGMIPNVLFVLFAVGGLLGFFYLFQRFYSRILTWALAHTISFLVIPYVLLTAGFTAWLGFTSPVIPLAFLFVLYTALFYAGVRIFRSITGHSPAHTVTLYLVMLGLVIIGTVLGPGIDAFDSWVPQPLVKLKPVSALVHAFPGMGKEFMPPLEEGSFLYMPTTMPHASIGEAMDVLRKQDMAITAIPEVDSAVGKIGRADTPLDPAPVSMVETVINYTSEYILDTGGRRKRFRFDRSKNETYKNADGKEVMAPDGRPYIIQGMFIRDKDGSLIPDPGGIPFRQWRPPLVPDLNPGRNPWTGIRNARDIWDAILEAADVPGTTSAPYLQPISARLVMLQSGMRAPMGIKIKGDDLAAIEAAGIRMEELLKSDSAPPAVDKSKVIADRIVGKPYLEIHIDRKAIARYGIQLHMVQKLIETAIGGMGITSTVEGRERYPVRVRYMRELRDSIESLGRILVTAPDGKQIPLEQVAEIKYVRGPQMIKSEDTFRVGYVLFDKRAGYAEVDAVEQARAFLRKQERVFEKAYAVKAQELGREPTSGEMDDLPGLNTRAVSEYIFAGSYENQLKAKARLAKILPLALFIIFIILYFQFRSVVTTLLVFSGIVVAWAGGFLLLWLYSTSWFLDVSIFGTNMRDLFQVHEYNMSIAIWVGFLALFGIASDNGVVIATYMRQVFSKRKPSTRKEVHESVIEAAERRVRPCLMTTATTILALIPILTSTGRGSDIMVPMALPSFGGMLVTIITIFLVPVLYSIVKETGLHKNR